MGSATVDSTAAGYRKWVRDSNIESGLGCGSRSIGRSTYDLKDGSELRVTSLPTSLRKSATAITGIP